MSASCIYEGTVSHRRHAPREHAFRYRMFMMYLDLGELPGLFDAHRLWSARRPAVAWFRRADYLGDPATPLDEAVRQLVAERTGKRPAGPVRVLTSLRYFGHCFNPVSFYYCFDPGPGPDPDSGPDADGDADRERDHPRCVVAEVTNTPWGERYAYVSDRLSSRHRKELHVSPFNPMDMEYEWQIGAPRVRLEVGIAADRAGRRVFDATLSLRRRPITRASLTNLLVRHPPMTIKVSAAIYAQAVRLRLKGMRPHLHPKALTR